MSEINKGTLLEQIESLERIIEIKNKQIKIIHDKYKELDDECNYLTNLINELRLNFSESNDFINALNEKLECNK